MLPTVAEGTKLFDYNADFERLIIGTAKKNSVKTNYDADVSFPEANADTGVYFRKLATEYSGTSGSLVVTNMSSHPVKLTVEVEAVSAAGDVELAAVPESGESATPRLYLGLVVGDSSSTYESAVAVLKAQKAVKTVTIEGSESNFSVEWVDSNVGYRYAPVDGASDWKTKSFWLEGTATKSDSSSSLTAPGLKVKWSWTDPTKVTLSGARRSSTLGADFDIAYKSGVETTYTFSGFENGEKITTVDYAGAIGARTAQASNTRVSSAGNAFTTSTVVNGGCFYVNTTKNRYVLNITK